MSSAQDSLGYDWWFEGGNTPVGLEATADAKAVLDASMQAVSGLEKLITQRGRQSLNARRCLTMVNDFSLGLQDMKAKLERIKAGDARAAEEIPGLLEAFRESLNFEALLEEMKGYRKNGTNALAEYIGTTIDVLSEEFNKVSEAVSPLSDALAIEAVSQGVRAQLSAVTGYQFHGKARRTPVAIPLEEAPMVVRPAENAKKVAVSEAPRAALGIVERMAMVLARLRDDYGAAVRGLIPALATGLTLTLGGCSPAKESAAPPRRTLRVIPAPAEPVAPVPAAVQAPEAATFSVSADAPHLWGALEGALAQTCQLSGDALKAATWDRVQASFDKDAAGFKAIVDDMRDRPGAEVRLQAIQANLTRYHIKVPGTYAEVLAGDATAIGHVGAYNMDAATIQTYAAAALNGYACP